jgi:hypothetical protein
VHLRRRDDDAGSGLLNFRADGRIECREPDFTTANGRDARCSGPAFRARQTASPNQGFVFGISKFRPDERVVACLRDIP